MALTLLLLGPFPVRLAGGPSRCAGRVEVQHDGHWGTVCDDDWGLPDAAVVCRQLGCGTALAAPPGAWFGEGLGPIWLNGVRCRGTEERLALCRHRGWRPHVCAHEEDASAVCSGTSLPGGPTMRLVGAAGRCAGRLEIFHAGHWGTVCDDLWGLPDAAVVCRQLGCGDALDAPRAAFFGEGTGPIWLDDVRCQGNESSLLECPASPWGVTNCQHREDAAVVCADELATLDVRPAEPTPHQPRMKPARVPPSARPRVPSSPRSTAAGQLTPRTARKAVPARLQGGRSHCAGRLELLFAGTWGSICAEGWDLAAARVLCHQLGCGRPRLIPAPCGPKAAGASPVVLQQVQCTGQELALEHCVLQPGDPSSCPMDRVAAVECEEPFQLRLVDGPRRCAGRLEVNRAGQWGTVCDDGWSGTNAAVVCQELGCGAAEAVGDLPQGRPHFGPGTGRIWLDDVRCRGQEGTLQDCAHRAWGRHDCTHQEDVGVVCQVWDPPLPPWDTQGGLAGQYQAMVILLSLQDA
ncbi:PREDICTED: soluble scavenger receptor cysteine-rich domain-containing protein SSC5D [Nipponia nippon]|uniref:soluble scavenger receptor cysteine-rich domain-containing protein SSC5D n=1 Tax=Nipponia nippon TaxID=128390 RepID=UPI00051179B8|nr:PREDICTED: soluble scavenger receptor cysteine-rich domain-containing protein SSC5D [Nipponia nippon]